MIAAETLVNVDTVAAVLLETNRTRAKVIANKILARSVGGALMGFCGALVVVDAVAPLIGAEALLAHAIVATLGVDAIGAEVALVNPSATLVKITAHEPVAVVALFASTSVST